MDLSALAREWAEKRTNVYGRKQDGKPFECVVNLKSLTALLERVRDEEREQCAKVAEESRFEMISAPIDHAHNACCVNVAATIRSRSSAG